jgi:hypothetical protein
VLRRSLAALALAVVLSLTLLGGAAHAQEPTSTSTHLPRTDAELDQLDDGNGLTAPWVIASGVACAVAVGGGGLWMKRRMDREAAADRAAAQGR